MDSETRKSESDSGFVLRDVRAGSQEEAEMKKIIANSRLFPDSTASLDKYELKRVQTVHNTHLAERFAEKKAEMKDQGCSPKELEEHFLFSLANSSGKAFSISKMGLRCHVRGKLGSQIGNDLKGVYIQKYSDVLFEHADWDTFYGPDIWVMVYKVIYGRVKYVPERRSDLMMKKVIPFTPALDPTPNHDCHMVLPSATSPRPWQHKSNDVSGMVYLYEYDDDCQHVVIPRQVLPSYILMYTKTNNNDNNNSSAFDKPPVLYESPKKPRGPHTPPNTPPNSSQAAQIMRKRNSDAENINSNSKRQKLSMSLSAKFGAVRQVTNQSEGPKIINNNNEPQVKCTKGTYGEYLQSKAQREALLSRNE
ncbi:unnamed protein product, partial [Owenia fusiformis]